VPTLILITKDVFGAVLHMIIPLLGSDETTESHKCDRVPNNAWNTVILVSSKFWK